MIAALGPDGVWSEERPAAPWPITWANVRSVADLFAGMQLHRIDVLYVHRSALELLGLPDSLPVPAPGERRPSHPFVTGATFQGQRVSQRALAPSIECAGAEVLIGAYQDGAGSPLEDARDAPELLAAACAFRDAFTTDQRPAGWAFRHSAILTGWKLMHAPWHGGRRGFNPEDMRENPQPPLEGVQDGQQLEIPYGGKWARSYSWLRRRTTRGRYALAWDVNGQRLAACSRLALGIGPVREREGWKFNPQLPGYHLVTRVAPAPFRGAIPPIMEPGWHTTPRLAMAAYLGVEYEVARSWVWERSVPYLDPFYESFRDARRRLLERDGDRGAAIALVALKQAYLQALGRLRSRRTLSSDPTHYRPHWYDTVIGQELAREYLRLHTLAHHRVPVIAVYFDTIILESLTTDPIAGAPEVLTVSDQLGKYKPVGALPLDEARGLLYPEGAKTERPQVGKLVKGLR